MKKKILTIILLFILSHCGYSPIYSNNNKLDVEIVINSLKGDREINNLIKSQIKKISKNNSTKKLDIEVNTDYIKSIISKDLTGAASEYQLSAIVNFKINDGKNINNIIIQEKINIIKNQNLYEEKNYERTIKTNFAYSITEKLILKLSILK